MIKTKTHISFTLLVLLIVSTLFPHGINSSKHTIPTGLYVHLLPRRTRAGWCEKSQSVALESQSVVLESQSVASKSRSVVLESQSVVIESQSVVLESQSVASKSQSVASKSQSVVLESRLFTTTFPLFYHF